MASKVEEGIDEAPIMSGFEAMGAFMSCGHTDGNELMADGNWWE
jgi:hypothetical protein